MRRRVGQHGVQDDDARHRDLVQQVQDLAAVGSAVDAVLVLHDGDVALVQLRGRPAERGGVVRDELRHDLVAGSWRGARRPGGRPSPRRCWSAGARRAGRR